MPPTASNFTRQETGACGTCGLADTCRAADSADSGPLRGGPFVVASLLYFLTPAALALVGSVVAGGQTLSQLSGGLLGLVVGLLVTTTAARRIAPLPDPEGCFEPR